MTNVHPIRPRRDIQVIADRVIARHSSEMRRVKEAHAQAAKRWFAEQGVCWVCLGELDARKFVAVMPKDLIVTHAGCEQ